MALRTLVNRLREHDWIAVGIEVLVVVVGVYIGLQASNWNQDRQDAARGTEYLQRFDDDLTAEIVLLRQTRAFQARVTAYGVGAVGYSEQGRLVDGSAWKTLLAYYHASQIWPFRQRIATIREILSSGDLRLIRNPALRSRITGHYDESAGSRAVEVIGLVPKYREHVRSMTPWPVADYIWSHCYKSDDAAGQEVFDCAPPISEAEATAIITRYRQDPALTGELRFWLASLGTIKTVLRQIQGEAELLDRDIRRELGKPTTPPPTP